MEPVLLAGLCLLGGVIFVLIKASEEMTPRRRKVLIVTGFTLWFVIVASLTLGMIIESRTATEEQKANQFGSGLSFGLVILSFPLSGLAVLIATTGFLRTKDPAQRIGYALLAAVVGVVPTWMVSVLISIVAAAPFTED